VARAPSRSDAKGTLDLGGTAPQAAGDRTDRSLRQRRPVPALSGKLRRTVRADENRSPNVSPAPQRGLHEQPIRPLRQPAEQRAVHDRGSILRQILQNRLKGLRGLGPIATGYRHALGAEQIVRLPGGQPSARPKSRNVTRPDR